jgi:hypothetical protein
MASGNDMHSPKKAGSGQGLTLVRFSPQPEPFLPLKPLIVSYKMCSRQAKQWTSGQGLPLVL